MATAEVKLKKPEFTNEPFVDFAKAENKAAMEAALKKVASEFGREYPMYIHSQEVKTTDKIKSTNPSHPSQVVGIVQSASAEQARQAIESAHAYFETWKKVPTEQRAEVLFKAASLIRQRKFEISALICYEVGKSWAEADADTAETIDFLEYYGREMLRLAGPHKVVPYQNERNFMVYIPLGAGAAIPPWNFPAAIATGMAAAALVAGNTVVLKPSEESSVIAAKMVEILYQAGIPRQALQFVTGLGEVAGDALVKHPKTRFVAFTGSKDVGLLISEAAGKRQPGQVWIKRAVLEMGGKDATIVDEEADVDAAVEGVAQAAFGYQGQKCSACSRAIVSERVYEAFVQKLVERAKKVTVGPSEDPTNYMGPVVSEGAMNGILNYIEVGKKEGKVVLGGGRAPGDGYFVQPTIIADVSPKARIAQEEIFGPVACLIPFSDEADAIRLANDIAYGLSSYVWTENLARAHRVAAAIEAGMCFVNSQNVRDLRQPFGGTKASGTGREGGTWSFEVFAEPKNVCVSIGEHHIPRWGV